MVSTRVLAQQYIVQDDNIFEALKSRSTIGVNLAPLVYLGGAVAFFDIFLIRSKSVTDNISKSLFEKEIAKFINLNKPPGSAVLPNIPPNVAALFPDLDISDLTKITNLTEFTNAVFSKMKEQMQMPGFLKTDFLFAMSFSYEFNFLPYMSVYGEAGFSSLNISIYDYRASLKTIPWGVGFKIFPDGKAPFGFFVFPKFGGTVININGTLLDALSIESIKEHGLYLSVEMGWRIQLFPKMSLEWPIKMSLDISIFDIGYYFIPWSGNIFSYPSLSSLKSLQPFAGFRFLILPKIGFSISF